MTWLAVLYFWCKTRHLSDKYKCIVYYFWWYVKRPFNDKFTFSLWNLFRLDPGFMSLGKYIFLPHSQLVPQWCYILGHLMNQWFQNLATAPWFWYSQYVEPLSKFYFWKLIYTLLQDTLKNGNRRWGWLMIQVNYFVIG